MGTDRDKMLVFGLVLVGIGILLSSRKSYAYEKPSTYWWEKIADKYAREFEIDPRLVKAIIMVESSGNPHAMRKENGYYSYGLMGVTPPTAKWLGYSGPPEGLLDPETNVYYGCKYLAWLKKRPYINGNIEKMAAGYNAGPDLKPWPYKYIEKVKKYMRGF